MLPEPTVFIVDDDEEVRQSLRWLVESVRLATETYATAQEFYQSYQPHRPGCLLLDVRMPGMSGLELQERLVAKQIRLPIIIITGHADVRMAVRAIKAGAVDFIEKPFSDQALLDRIQAAIAQDLKLRAVDSRRAVIADRLKSLTAREREVLDLVIGGQANREIADTLDVSCKTVEAHRARIMKKMEADNLADLMRELFLSGAYRMDKDSPPLLAE